MNSIVQKHPCGCSINVTNGAHSGPMPSIEVKRCNNAMCGLSNEETLKELKTEQQLRYTANAKVTDLEKRLMGLHEEHDVFVRAVFSAAPCNSIAYTGDIAQYLQSVFDKLKTDIASAQDSVSELQRAYNHELGLKQQYRDVLIELVKCVTGRYAMVYGCKPADFRKAIIDGFESAVTKGEQSSLAYSTKLDTVLNQLSDVLGPLSVNRDSTAEELEQAVADRMTELCDLGVDIAMGVRHEENLTKKEREAAETVKKLYQERDGARSVLAAVYEEAQYRPGEQAQVLGMSMHKIATLAEPYQTAKVVKSVWNPEVGDKCVNIHNKQQYQIVTFLQNADGEKFVVFMPLIKQAHPDIQSYADFFKNFKELP